MLSERARIISTIITFAITSTHCLAIVPSDTSPADHCAPASLAADTAYAGAFVKGVFPPVQLDVSTSFEPTLFPSGGLNYVIYELHLQNYTDEPMSLRGLEVFDAGSKSNRSIATFPEPSLHERLLPIGAETIDADHPLEGGKRAVALICLAFDDKVPVPATLGHRVLVGDSIAEGPVIGTRRADLKVVAPPVRGADWLADNGPSLKSHHRTGLFVAGGRAQISRRFAIDWKQQDAQGATFSGDAAKVEAYYAYGESVFAVADATVVSAIDGVPDNIPRTAAGFETAVTITMDNVAGNAIVLDLGDGQFAYYAHLKPGSVQVKAGDRVRRGDVLAAIGNSGDARWPHLHFQVATSPHILDGEGVPFVLDRFRTRATNGEWQTRTDEFPLGDIVVEIPAEAPSTHR